MNMPAARSLAAGFANPVFDSQSAFRACMEALATPGRVRSVGEAMPHDVPLMASAAAVILAICDFETPLYLSPCVAAIPGVPEYLCFHTDAPLLREPSHAAFAVLDLRHDALDLGSFAQGTAEYPDRAATIIALCDSLQHGAALGIAGPGIAGVSEVRVAPLPDSFTAQWQDNRASFPLGVDIIFVAPGRVVGLPRSTRIIAGAG